MDSVGHLKIADFGLALENMRGRKKAKEHAGTLGYIAPEMLLGQRYNAAVDWWAFGVILYTMATGEFPFYCGNTSETLVASVLQDTLSYPECLSTATQDILKKPCH
ncbi:kinase C theta type [Pelobates cultripes]|uniref:Kinase C theta type, partial n=1 Tax=Pelobates cultripes TaxID=61616 RepID=A0AAD1TMC2_PELCU|nr:kinase C theta type [Pelobates cultripes]